MAIHMECLCMPAGDATWLWSYTCNACACRVARSVVVVIHMCWSLIGDAVAEMFSLLLATAHATTNAWIAIGGMDMLFSKQHRQHPCTHAPLLGLGSTMSVTPPLVGISSFTCCSRRAQRSFVEVATRKPVVRRDPI